MQSGYRHSADQASKNRVREALNAGLRALPEWPEELQTTSGQTVGYNNNNQQQQQQPQPGPQFQQQSGGYVGMQVPQQTGYSQQWNGNGLPNQGQGWGMQQQYTGCVTCLWRQ